MICQALLLYLKKSEMYNVNANVIFRWFLFCIKAIDIYIREKYSFTCIFQGLCLDVKNSIVEPLSMAVCKIAYLTYQTFCLDLLT